MQWETIKKNSLAVMKQVLDVMRMSVSVIFCMFTPSIHYTQKPVLTKLVMT